MLKKMSKRTCRTCKYERALREINKTLKDWSKGQLPVAINSKVANRSVGYALSLDDMLAQIRNIALAALDEDELVPGTPDQHYHVWTDADLPPQVEEEPEECDTLDINL